LTLTQQTIGKQAYYKYLKTTDNLFNINVFYGGNIMINITKIKNFLYELDNEIGEIKDTLKEAWEMSDLKELLSDIRELFKIRREAKERDKLFFKEIKEVYDEGIQMYIEAGLAEYAEELKKEYKETIKSYRPEPTIKVFYEEYILGAIEYFKSLKNK